ncbi:DUF2851 family protein [Polaribacter sp.]|nr:DUF2851 family protein [Polaribacter sp.]
MKEDLLHYIWKYKLFDFKDLKTTAGETIQLIKIGHHNYNAGPDFLNANLIIDNQNWFGNVEIHIKSSDWYAHHHEVDTNYDAIILHVVWEDDVTVYNSENNPIPTLVLKNLVDTTLLKNYRSLMQANTNWIPCENELTHVDVFVLNSWKERLYFERLERKSLEIKTILNSNNFDFEATLFVLLCKNFGLKVNGEAFLQLAKSVEYSVVKKARHNLKELTALLFGQAGFLNENLEDSYYKNLKEEFNFLKQKFSLKPIAKQHFSFFRMRPSNFPTIRIAQFSSLLFNNAHLFLQVMNANKKEKIYEIFNFNIDEYWRKHYDFNKKSKRSTAKKLSKPFIDLLIINTIIPLRFLYEQSRGEVGESKYLDLLRSVNPEKNSITEKFDTLGVSVENAFDSQSLLQLKNEYCTMRKCLQCAVGKTILKRKA